MSGETFLDGRVTLHAGDCLAVMATLPAGSIAAVVTDPPYGLSFMGKAWDHGVPGVPFWRAALRLLKPGGHLVAFGGQRTFGRMQVAIEEAGFEVRDTIANMIDTSNAAGAFLGTLNDAQRAAFLRCIADSQFGGLMAWAFGQGFPKALDVSKAIAKRRDDEDEPEIRKVCRFVRAAMDRRGLKSRHLVAQFGNCDPRLIDHWAARDTDSQPSLPTPAQWQTLKAALDLGDAMDAAVERLNGRKGELGDKWKGATVVGEHAGDPGGFGEGRFTVRDNLVRDLSELQSAAAWQGWHTALKPGFEPIILARKPLAGGMTVAENVLAHGTGALNIDACRIEGAKPDTTRGAGGQHGRFSALAAQGRVVDDGRGRWPANLVHDGSPDVVAAFPETASGIKQGGNYGRDGGAWQENTASGMFNRGGLDGVACYGDQGSAARFFYTSKADGDDRIGSKHPTVKPVDLMQWLVRLVTPPGGTVLDPFAGTGTTGEAAWREGFAAVLIEREAEYQADIRRRMALAIAGAGERARESLKAAGKVKAAADLPLFGGME